LAPTRDNKGALGHDFPEEKKTVLGITNANFLKYGRSKMPVGI
jgi:hypothetical protein